LCFDTNSFLMLENGIRRCVVKEIVDSLKRIRYVEGWYVDFEEQMRQSLRQGHKTRGQYVQKQKLWKGTGKQTTHAYKLGQVTIVRVRGRSKCRFSTSSASCLPQTMKATLAFQCS
jgi:hypothetical protein